MKRIARSSFRLFEAGLGLAGAAYLLYAGFKMLRYGHSSQMARECQSNGFARFIPRSEIHEHHEIVVDAPAEIAFLEACGLDLLRSLPIRAVFKLRGLVLGGSLEHAPPRLGLVEQARAWGWGVLSEIPGQEIVFGAVTQPWLANPVFRALPAEEFAQFNDPGFVKIVWTIRTTKVHSMRSLVSTETLACTTDSLSRAKFRRYWAFVCPGVLLIRLQALRLIRRCAERTAGERLRRRGQMSPDLET